MVIELERCSVSPELLEQLKCPICHGLLRDPMQTPCRHVFCRPCILGWLDRRSTCPMDQKRLRFPDLTKPALLVDDLLEGVIVKCPFYAKGCLFEGKMNNHAAHLESEHSQELSGRVSPEEGPSHASTSREVSGHHPSQQTSSREVSEGAGRENEVFSIDALMHRLELRAERLRDEQAEEME